MQIVYHHYAFIGSESQLAAQGAECANEQGKFWDWLGYLFTHQAGENQGHFSKDNLKQFATLIGGLDPAKFDACLDSGKYAAEVQAETEQGNTLGVQATPTFFVNGRRIEGLLSQDQFAVAVRFLDAQSIEDVLHAQPESEHRFAGPKRC